MKIIVLLFFCINFLFSESIDDILKVIQTKSDLSEKTKLENSGVSFIYTRSDIERMNVNKLKDILITIPFLDYKESSYGFPDLFTFGDNKAFISNSLRVFIDNQEIATGMYGSGFMLLGDIDLDFIDHIEVYLQSPTYEYTTEPTLILVKLYTKTAKKDNGGKIKLSHNIYNSNSSNIYYANQIENCWNYFTYFSYNQNKRKKYIIEDQKVSRDYPTYQFLSSIYNDNNRFLFQLISQKKDSFLDTSIDLTPVKAKVDSGFIHLGYDGNYNNLYLLADFDYKLTKSYFQDDVIPLEEYNYLYPIASQISTIRSNLYNIELKYKYITEKNTLITGVKFRYKTFEYKDLYRNGIELPSTGNTNQKLCSVFLENQYSMKNNSIFNLGLMKANIINNNSKQQDDIFNYRLGHTFTTEKLTFKTVFSHTEFSIDPYLVNSTNFFIKDEVVDKITEISLIENLIYRNDDNKFELLLSYTKFKNLLVPDLNDRYLLYNSDRDIKNYNIFLSWTKEYNEIDKLFLSMEYQKHNLDIDKIDTKIKSVIRNLNSFQKYDIFNEVVIMKFNDNSKYYSIYNCGVKYNYSPDIVIGLKGENMFNNSYKQYYFSANPETLEQQPEVAISPIDRNIILSIEYLF